MKRLLWPAVIILSTIATGVVTFVITDTPVRPFIALWFLFICPGMAPARLFRLIDPMIEWTLAVALSFAIDAIVAGILMYAGRWSPPGTLAILMAISLGGAIMQIGFSRKFDEMVSISTSTHVHT